MKLYQFLNRFPFPRSYVGKLLLICFLGTHAPLVAFAAYALLALPLDAAVTKLALLILLATLAGTAVTLALVRGLLAPILQTEKALKAYVSQGVRPVLPTHYRDEAGSLMAEVQHVVDHLEKTLNDAQRQAMTDPLTAIGNRRWLTKEAERAFALMRRSGAPLSAVTFDIDHFKSLNDRHGHDAGDAVLREVAASVRGQLRSYDLFARTGGEEFCIVLPNTGLAQAGAIAERLRAHLHNLRRANDDHSEVTASFGVACATPATVTLSQVLSQADVALYQAKNGGRDRVCIAPDPLALVSSAFSPAPEALAV